MLYIERFLLVQLALVVLMVTLIHFIEAYGLNPAIYSAHLKLHPLLVLTVLVVAEHSLGVWGLLLAGVLAMPFTVHLIFAWAVMRPPTIVRTAACFDTWVSSPSWMHACVLWHFCAR